MLQNINELPYQLVGAYLKHNESCSDCCYYKKLFIKLHNVTSDSFFCKHKEDVHAYMLRRTLPEEQVFYISITLRASGGLMRARLWRFN